MGNMIERQSWQTFKDSGLLWFVNSILHVFGYAICIQINDDTKEIIDVYPARVKFRGFSESSNTKGYINISEYLKTNIEDLVKESKE